MKGLPLKYIAQQLGVSHECSTPVWGFNFNSQKVKKGDLFFAIKGEKTDGHQYLEQVAALGALGAVVSHEYQGDNFGLELLPVSDVKGALHFLAKKSFSKRKEKVVALTGSMGKTTTKEFLATLLEGKFRVAKTKGNENTQLSVPLSLLNLEGEYDVLVLEMGMSAHGHIHNLVAIAPPDYAIVTRIAPAGMENFTGGLEAIARAKGEIFTHPKTKIGLMSAQAARFPLVSQRGTCQKFIYGEGGDFVLHKNLSVNDSPPLPFTLEGSHLLENYLGAVALCRLMGLSWYDIKKQTKKLTPFDRRFEKIERDGVIFIQDSYNANPDSMAIALKNLPKPQNGGRRIGVLGSMVDLGDKTKEFHQSVGSYANAHLDEMLLIGEEARWLADSFKKKKEYYSSLEEMKRALFNSVKPGDVVLIKGANHHRLWELLDATFPD